MAANLKFSNLLPNSSTEGRAANTTMAWIGDSWNIWLSPDFGSFGANATLTWLQAPYGHEEVFVLSMAAPHVGPSLITGTADLGGLVHDGNSPDWLRYPGFSFFGPGHWGGEGVGIGYSEATKQLPSGATVPEVIAFAQADAWGAYGPSQGSGSTIQVSIDGGTTWLYTAFNASDRQGIQLSGLVVSAWNGSIMLATAQGEQPLRTDDGGATWTRVSSLPAFRYLPYSGNRYNMSRPLVTDRPLVAPAAGAYAELLYADCSTGTIHASDDGGVTFTIVAGFAQTPRCVVEATPSPTGGLYWIAADKKGLYLLTGRGESRKIDRNYQVDVAHSVAVGVSKPGFSEPAVYVFGLLATSFGDYRPIVSLDRGDTWTELLSSNGKGLGNWPATLVASRQHFGLFAVGSFGRGAWFANASLLL